MKVEICVEGGPFQGVTPVTIRKRALRMMRYLKLKRAELSISLVNDACIQELNRKYRKKNKPTDVLAFPLTDRELGEPLPEGLLGDVVLSIDTARKQARQHNHSLLVEVTKLLAHGLLHLIGYDHQTDSDEAQMNQIAQLLEKAAQRD